MASKISTMNPNRASTLIITNYGDHKTEERRRRFTENYKKDCISKSIRETRYFETIRNMTASGKPAPLYLGNQSYDELFKKLIESCRNFFSKEYGKNEDDYNMFVKNCTKIYEEPKRYEDILIFDRMRYFRYEQELAKKSKTSLLSRKKSKSSIWTRHKSKGELSSRTRFKQSGLKRSRSLTSRRTKKTKRTEALGGMFERSASELLDFSDEDEANDTSKEFHRKAKPFIYKLSDPEMIRKGYTVNYQPPMRLVTFFAYPACSRTFWFQPRNEAVESYYPDGRVSWRHEKIGTAAVYYDNGETAISFLFGRIGPLIVVYSKSEKIRDITIKQVPVALFDLRGNGIVYDKKNGKKRLIYDQAQGIWLDSPSKYPIPWKWKSYKDVECRRAELKFVPPTMLDDFDFLYREKDLKPNESSIRKIKNKKLTSIWESERKTKFKRRTRKTDYLKLSKSKKIYGSKNGFSRSDFSTLSYKRKAWANSILRDIDMPKVLRFIGRGFILKPVLTPCEDMEPLKINVATLATPAMIIPMDSVPPDQRQDNRPKTPTKRKRVLAPIKSRGSNIHSEDRIFREPLTRCQYKKKTRCLLKPIVLNLADKISLTITDQEHIHIDFISFPVHYCFNIGVRIELKKLDSVFDVRIPKVNKDYIPSTLEALKEKCPILKNVNKKITNLRKRALQKSRRDCIRSLQMWGQDKYLGTVPLCKLMNNTCGCRKCYCVPNNIEAK